MGIATELLQSVQVLQSPPPVQLKNSDQLFVVFVFAEVRDDLLSYVDTQLAVTEHLGVEQRHYYEELLK